METAPVLSKGLKQRQLSMLAMGGVIGAGLFVGSSVVLSAAGPAAFLAYALMGVLIVMVMRMLGEMATAHPATGSFADYSRKALGGWAGFSVGWLYWYLWVVTVGFEAVAGAKILTYWIDAPLWVLSLVLMSIMTVVNLLSVSSFGEFEFWFAGIKVAAILVFILLAALFVLGMWPGRGLDFGNVTGQGGFMPHGPVAVLSGSVLAVFAMCGAEIVTIAAAESPDPAQAIAKATNAVITRIALFFVAAVFLLSAVVPWNEFVQGSSPFVAALDTMGIPFAGNIMNAVVLTAVLSCLNSGLYTASRMAFVLAARGEAPARLTRVSSRGVPAAAILFSAVIGFLCVILAAVSPDTVFLFLLNSVGAVILFVYLLICVSQIALRWRTPADQLRVKMWCFPALSLATTAGIVAILVQMALDTTVRSQFLLSSLAWGVILIAYGITRARGRSGNTTASTSEGAATRIELPAIEGARIRSSR